jgi:iron(III) transport system substrate-binding protein
MRKRSTGRLAATVAAVSVLAACGGTDGAAGDDLADSTRNVAAAAESDCPAQDDPLVTAAQKEGVVVWTGTPSGDIRKLMPPAFQERYGVRIDYLGARNSETAAKLRAERAAGVFSHDVFTGGGDTMSNVYHEEGWLGSLKDALPPAVLEGKNWIVGEAPWVDPEKDKILKLTDYKSNAIVVNANHVEQGEVTSWKDLLDPKFKGKLISDDPTSSGGGANDVGLFREDLGDQFVEDLYVNQEPTFLSDARQEIDGLAQGKFIAGWSLHQAETDKAISDGLPLRLVWPKDARPVSTSGSGLLALNNKAPHPNAAKLLVSWLACKDGNALFNKSIVTASARSDVPLAEGVEDHTLLEPGVDYFDSYSWEFLKKGKREARNYIKSRLGQK